MEDMCRKFDEATEDLYREIDKLFSGLTDSITAIFGIERSLERSVADIFFRQDTGESIPKVEQPLSRQLMLDEISGIEKDHADLMSSLYGELSQFLVVDVQELEFSQLLDVSKAIAGMIEDENLYGFCIVIKKMASDAHDVLHRLKVLKRNMRTDGGIVIAKSRDSRCISSLDFGEEDILLISSSSSINQVASQLYKFPANISNEITQSLRHKGLLRYHAVPDILKKHTEDLKEKLKGVSGYELPLTEEQIDTLKEEAKANRDHMREAGNVRRSLEKLGSLKENVSQLENETSLKSEEVASATAGKEEALLSALAEIKILEETVFKRSNSCALSYIDILIPYDFLFCLWVVVLKIAALEIQIPSMKENLEEHDKWRAAQANYERQGMPLSCVSWQMHVFLGDFFVEAGEDGRRVKVIERDLSLLIKLLENFCNQEVT
ncbi:nuclear-pore anchor-like protein [Corchorus olitorius]|uniref:Nuclear-pore anchor-like protein n=1 Tax=Corchorus olitorius TaxID=93759 RepID=A0A1R3GDZ1_9ROSI|nr:nuclear-pore anchor-like protein [Corchorus olitorius]